MRAQRILHLALTLSVLVTMTTCSNDSNDSLSLPQDLDLDSEDSQVTGEAGHQIQLYSRNLSRAVKIRDHDYFLRPPYFPLVLRPKSEDFVFPTRFYSKTIYATKDGHLLSDSKDLIMTHFKRQLQICHNIYTRKRNYFLHKTVNKHHEFTQLANVLWDRYKDIEISVNKLFLELPLNLKYKLKQFHIDKKRSTLSDWWNIETTLDAEFTDLFNRIRYDLYKAFDMFDADLHVACFQYDLHVACFQYDKHLIELTTEPEVTIPTIKKFHFNDSLVESEEDISFQ
ncbi:hypothetical protein M8J75_015801 [Diaphorina citri]|nr:hypothetical protein M8J75_015801 [Diaphorina citri]